MWDATPVYFHNVYAPVEDDQRAAFFEALPVDFGDNDSGVHIVGGDFNLPVNSILDATTPPANHNAGKAECMAWLAALRFTDAWRLIHPSTRKFSGPRRRNRLDYIYVDNNLAMYYLQSSLYETNQYHGDHLCHTTILATTPSAQQKQKAIWRLPRELLHDPRTV
ncbi:hypothetical protein AC1031_012032 [Aphanomyces cochlioides]|nr:hypothetical protein AC1031_012032 [Aphanomyces cochlioides]